MFMSMGVVSLVVWLALLFLSITEGIERMWQDKLTALHAPIRITPTQDYYNSYYYLVDSISSESGYSYKSIEEKRLSPLSNPYLQDIDVQPPPYWTPPDLDSQGQLRDPVKTAYALLEKMQKKYEHLTFQSYEAGAGLLKLQLKKQRQGLTQACYFASMPDKNPKLESLIIPPSRAPIKLQEILLPKSFQDSGASVGDQGHITYNALTPNGMQEQFIPISIAGFYDPGILSVGIRCALVHPSIARTINTNGNSLPVDKTLGNGIHVWPQDLNSVKKLTQDLKSAFEAEHIASYWEITPFYAYEHARELVQQFQSDKYLFTLVATAILLVACCNIISLLILLVNDKKKEIAILQTLGASQLSIATIFALCGSILGILSASLGAIAAFFTLKHIDICIGWISSLYGQELFSSTFYGPSLPSTLSASATLFVMVTTPILALFAAVIPALKACTLKPAPLLRSE